MRLLSLSSAKVDKNEWGKQCGTFFKCSFVGVKKDRTQKSNLSRTKILEHKFNELWILSYNWDVICGKVLRIKCLISNFLRLKPNFLTNRRTMGENWGQDMKWMIIKRVQDDINRFTDYPKCCYTEGMSCHLIPTFLYGLKGKIISTCSFNLPFSIVLESLSFCTHV